SGKVAWEFWLGEWNAQFYGDRAFRISEQEKKNLRFEAKQFQAGKLWHRWDYPHHVGASDFDERQAIFAQYITDNWRAHRTWGISANSPWEYATFWKPRAGMDKKRRELKVNWDELQKPGFSADYYQRYQGQMSVDYERSDWIPTAAAEALIRNNQPLLGYVAGKPGSFTSKDHNFHPGETVEKQLIVINNSRETVSCECAWSLNLPKPIAGKKKTIVRTGEQERIPLRFDLPAVLAPGSYQLDATY